MDYINEKTGQIAVEQGLGFHIDLGNGAGMLLPGQFVRGNPDWKPLPQIDKSITEILKPPET